MNQNSPPAMDHNDMGEASGTRLRGRGWRILERALWVMAVLCVLPFVTAWAARTATSGTVVSEVSAPHRTAPATVVTEGAQVPAPGEVPVPPTLTPGVETSPPASVRRRHIDQNPNSSHELWAPERLSAFERLRAAISPTPVATLSLPALDTRIPVFSGDSEVNMTLGAGHLTDTAPLDGEGNIALTAHRDGSFRILKDVAVGDPVELEVDGQIRRFVVTEQLIVTPDRVDVLRNTPDTMLTLITCYPFYFVGNAPERYILRAVLEFSPEAVTASTTPGGATDRAAPVSFVQTINREKTS